jgi:ABC-type transport system involved in cytochrome c biogenesis permease subunit
MRIAELALLLVPIALAMAWICGIRGLSPRGTLAAILLLAALGLSLVYFGESRAFRGRYVPARLQAGSQIVPGGGAR